MLLAGSPQTPALGAAIFVAVAAGAGAGGHSSFEEAQAWMTSMRDERFDPDPAARAVYDELFSMYRELHDAFGAVSTAGADFPSRPGGIPGGREPAGCDAGALCRS